MKYEYVSPEVTLIRLAAVRTIQLSSDKDDWYDEELPEDDETELL